MKKNDERLGPFGILMAFILLIWYCILVAEKKPEEKNDWF